MVMLHLRHFPEQQQDAGENYDEVIQVEFTERHCSPRLTGELDTFELQIVPRPGATQWKGFLSHSTMRAATTLLQLLLFVGYLQTALVY